MSNARVLIASHYNATRFSYDCSAYEAAQSFAACDEAHILAPPATHSPKQLRLDRIAKRIKRWTGRGAVHHLEPVEVEQDYDLFVYITTGLPDLPEVARIRHWRRRSRKAACIVLKAYATEIERLRSNLSVLNEFDIAYSGTWMSLPVFQSAINTPARYLAYGVPALEMAPNSLATPRTIDFYAMGRRPPSLHDQMLRAMVSGSINYMFDSFDPSVPFIKDFAGHCLSKAHLLRQTKFFANFGIRSFQHIESELAGTEDAVTYRCYEGAAAGTVMIGTPPTSGDFASLFDWEDVIIPAPIDTKNFLGLLEDLEAQPKRIEEIRQRNVVNSLLRHDLAYRFETILRDLEIEPHEKLEERKERLARAAAALIPAHVSPA